MGQFSTFMRQQVLRLLVQFCRMIKMDTFIKVVVEPFLFLSLLLGLASCEMFEVHPYGAQVSGEKALNAKHIRQIEQQLAEKDTLRFAFISDTQRWYDETRSFVNAINGRNDIDFVIHGGDMSDFGATHEFVMQRDILLDLQVPWVVLIGNHDCLGTGEDVFAEIFGPPNFYFVAGKTLFIGLNTNCMEYDYAEPVPDFNFLENLLAHIPDSVERTIAVMHVPPFDLEFNNNVAHVFQLYLRAFPGLQCCLYGHGHQYATDELFNDGVLYHQTPSAKKRGYIEFTLTTDGYEQHLVSF